MDNLNMTWRNLSRGGKEVPDDVPPRRSGHTHTRQRKFDRCLNLSPGWHRETKKGSNTWLLCLWVYVSVCVYECVCVCVCVSRDVQEWVLHECTAKGKEGEEEKRGSTHSITMCVCVCMKCVFESVKFEWRERKKNRKRNPGMFLNIHFLFWEFQTVILVSKYIIPMQRPFSFTFTWTN